MFEWKVEEMALMNKNRFDLMEIAESTAREDKIAFVDSKRDGKLSYILQLEKKFKEDEPSLPKTSCFSNVKTVSLLAWIKRNDSRKLIDTKYKYGLIYLESLNRSICKLNRKCEYDIYDDYVDEVFYRMLQSLIGEEKRYFSEHDEYSIEIKKFNENIRTYKTLFGIEHVWFGTDVTIRRDDDDRKGRKFTIDELKTLNAQYNKVKAYIEELSKELHIVY